MNYRKIKDMGVVQMGYGRKGINDRTGHGTARETLKVETPMGVAFVETGEDVDGRPFVKVELNADKLRTVPGVEANGDKYGIVAKARGARPGYVVDATTGVDKPE